MSREEDGAGVGKEWGEGKDWVESKGGNKRVRSERD